MSNLQPYLKKILLAGDMAANALGPASLDDITVSAHAGMAALDGHDWGIQAAAALDKAQPGHCYIAILNDIKRAQQAVAELSPYADRCIEVLSERHLLIPGATWSNETVA